MALAAADLAAIRSWVGSEPVEPILEAHFERLGSSDAVALAVLRERLADLLAEPTRFAVEGDASWSYDTNVKALQERVDQLAARVEGPAGATVGRLSRPRRR